jgi:hypothetical protein
MTVPDPKRAPFVDLSFAPSITLVSLVRQFASDFYTEQLGEGDTVSRLALTTHEILENAVKYSIDGMTRIRIEYLPDEGSGKVRIQTWNRPQPEHLALLRQNMDELTNAADPMAHYLELIRRTSTRAEGSGLGLGRIRAEAEMSVRYAIDGEWLQVVAEAPVAPPAR